MTINPLSHYSYMFSNNLITFLIVFETLKLSNYETVFMNINLLKRFLYIRGSYSTLVVSSVNGNLNGNSTNLTHYDAFICKSTAAFE